MPVYEMNERYEYFKSEWRKCRDCIAGQKAVKAARTRYLPALGGSQSYARYEKYIKRALFFNATRRTAEALTGFLFRKSPIFTPDNLDLLDSFTNSSGGFLAFIQGLAMEVISVGRVILVVDSPIAGGDPKITYYRTEDFINWKINASGKLIQAVFKEKVLSADSADEFSNKKEIQYRVFDIFRERYRQRIFKEVKPGEWAPVLEIFPTMNGASLSELPIVVINSVNLLPEPSEPPLIDVVNVNLSHYRSSADLESGRHFTGFPTPWASGFDIPGESLEIGSVAWVSDNPNAKAGFLEFTGQGLGSLENALTEKAQMMSVLGARILEAQKKSTEAADTHRLRYAGEQSILSKAAGFLGAGISVAMRICANWRKLPDADGFGVSLNKDYASTTADPQLVTTLFGALQGGAISYDTWFYNLKRWELAPEGQTLDDELGLIEARNSNPES